jgi:hypothetical protein
LLVAILAAALAGLSAWVIVDRTGAKEVPAAAPPHNLASDRIAAMLRARMVAVNSGSGEAAASFYAPTGVLEERDVSPPVVSTGKAQLTSRFDALWSMGLRLKSDSPIIQFGRSIAEVATVPGDSTSGWLLVYQLGTNGKIAHQWVLGE